MALTEHVWLHGELAHRGINSNTVVVADDGNLQVADWMGFDTITAPNLLGSKINSGVRHAVDQGADWVCFTGSDNWLHPDLFNLDQPAILSGRKITIVDLDNTHAKTLNVNTHVGAPPWIIPADSFGQLEPDRTRGLEGAIYRALNKAPEWVFHDPNPAARVDFKTTESMSPYSMFGTGGEDPWPLLAAHYPAHLVDLAREVAA